MFIIKYQQLELIASIPFLLCMQHELTALMCACMSGHIEVACLLAQADADINLTDMVLSILIATLMPA